MQNSKEPKEQKQKKMDGSPSKQQQPASAAAWTSWFNKKMSDMQTLEGHIQTLVSQAHKVVEQATRQQELISKWMADLHQREATLSQSMLQLVNQRQTGRPYDNNNNGNYRPYRTGGGGGRNNGRPYDNNNQNRRRGWNDRGRRDSYHSPRHSPQGTESGDYRPHNIHCNSQSPTTSTAPYYNPYLDPNRDTYEPRGGGGRSYNGRTGRPQEVDIFSEPKREGDEPLTYNPESPGYNPKSPVYNSVSEDEDNTHKKPLPTQPTSPRRPPGSKVVEALFNE